MVLAGGLIGPVRAHHSPVDPSTSTTVAVVSWATEGDTIRVCSQDGSDLGRIWLFGTRRPQTAHDDRP